MLAEITSLLADLPSDASRTDYLHAVVERNLLGKPTRRARELTSKHLTSLYALEPSVTLFRVFRKLWDLDVTARPMLALTMALARDPILRLSQAFVLGKHPGESVSPEEFQAVLNAEFGERLSAVSLASYARNLSGSWSQAGYLKGKAKKLRDIPAVTPVNATFCLLLAYLEGLSAQRLFTSSWAELLGGGIEDRVALATAASSRGLMVFMKAGGVMEARFPDLLFKEEEALLHE